MHLSFSFLVLVLLGFAGGVSAAEESSLQGLKRVVVLGDSITQDGNYVADVECWLLAQGIDLEVIDLGLGSETVSDLTPAENAGHLKSSGFVRPAISERLDRALAATKPDVVVACYGMNDGGALPANEQGTARYAEAITRLRDTCLKSGVKRVILVTPPVRECKADQWATNTHDQNLTNYTVWLNGQRAKGWEVVDIHTPMRAALDDARKVTPDFRFSKDNVHPGREGHWVMAQALLGQWLGAKVDGVAKAEDLFPAKGAEIRKLIRERQGVLFNAYMTAIGHQRPGVAGGPKAKPGLPIPEAKAKAAALTAAILELSATVGRTTPGLNQPNDVPVDLKKK